MKVGYPVGRPLWVPQCLRTIFPRHTLQLWPEVQSFFSMHFMVSQPQGKVKTFTLACSNGTTGFGGNVTTVSIVLNPPVIFTGFFKWGVLTISSNRQKR